MPTAERLTVGALGSGVGVGVAVGSGVPEAPGPTLRGELDELELFPLPSATVTEIESSPGLVALYVPSQVSVLPAAEALAAAAAATGSPNATVP